MQPDPQQRPQRRTPQTDRKPAAQARAEPVAEGLPGAEPVLGPTPGGAAQFPTPDLPPRQFRPELAPSGQDGQPLPEGATLSPLGVRLAQVNGDDRRLRPRFDPNRIPPQLPAKQPGLLKGLGAALDQYANFRDRLENGHIDVQRVREHEDCKVLQAGKQLTVMDPDLTATQGALLLRRARQEFERLGANSNRVPMPIVLTPEQTGLPRTIQLNRDGTAHIHLQLGHKHGGELVVDRWASVKFHSPTEIELTPHSRTPLPDSQTFHAGAQKLAEMGRNLKLSPNEAKELLVACHDYHRMMMTQWGPPPTPYLVKARDSNLPRSLLLNPDGSVAIMLREKIGEGGQKTAKLAALVRFAVVPRAVMAQVAGRPSFEQVVKTTAVVGQDGEMRHRNHLDEQKANERMKGAAGVAQSYMAFHQGGTQKNGHTKLKHVQLQPLYAGGDLFDRLYKSGRPLSGEEKMRFARELLTGLHETHERGLLHCDIKPENVFLKRDDDGKEHAALADYGFARERVNKAARAQPGGTPLYAPPEYAEGAKHGHYFRTSKEDVFSMGLILYQIIHSEQPYIMRRPWLKRREVMNREEMKAHGLVPTGHPIHDLMVAMLDPDPNKRPSAEEALDRFRLHAD